MTEPLALTRTGRIFFARRAIRTFGFGGLLAALALHLARMDLTTPQIVMAPADPEGCWASGSKKSARKRMFREEVVRWTACRL